MRSIVIVIVLLLLVKCSPTRITNTSSNTGIMLWRLPQAKQKDTLKNNSVQVEVTYRDVTEGYFEFALSAKNNSSDTLALSPDQFYYKPFFNRANTASETIRIVRCVDPEEEIERLHQQRLNLEGEMNPYSLNNKSAGTIATEGLVTGTIALLVGMQPGSMETIRLQDENQWYDNQSSGLGRIDRLLLFWRGKEQPTQLLPEASFEGTFFFPITKGAVEVELSLPLGSSVFSYSYKQIEN